MKQYGANVKFIKEDDSTPELSSAKIKILQQKIGGLFFYGRATEITLLVALSSMESAQSHGTEAMARSMMQLLNYCATHTDAVIQYKKIDTIIAIHSHASYLSKKKMCS